MNLSHYKNVFKKLQIDGFNIKAPLTWSFFFFSEEKEGLQKVISELDTHNYVCRIDIVEDEKYRLIADKIEILTPEKLTRRQEAFKELADYCGVLYDGWEVTK